MKPCPGHALSGVFGGDADLEGGYAWLTDDHGRSHEVWYPAGWEVRFQPSATLVGPDGVEYARNGDRLMLHGSHADGGALMGLVGPIFEASSVERA
jgi:hypothetical protein